MKIGDSTVVEFGPKWNNEGYNSEQASKANIKKIVMEARSLPGGRCLRCCRRILIEAGVHKSPNRVYWKKNKVEERRMGKMGDSHYHVTVKTDVSPISWHINVMKSKGANNWSPYSVFRRAGQRHYQQESPGKRVPAS